jgi:hypothetical protein
MPQVMACAQKQYSSGESQEQGRPLGEMKHTEQVSLLYGFVESKSSDNSER